MAPTRARGPSGEPCEGGRGRRGNATVGTTVRAVARLELLFNRSELRRLLEEKLTGMQVEIGRAPDDHVLTVDADEWAAALAERYSIEIPVLDLPNRWMDEADDIQFDVSHQGFMRALPPGGGPFYVGGTRHVVHVPFSGDPEVFFLKPSSFTLNPPRAAISGSDLLVVVEYPNDAPQDIAGQVDGTVTAVQQWLGFAANDANGHNGRLRNEAVAAIERRRVQIRAKQERIAASGIPVRPRNGDKPRIVEAIRRRPTPLPVGAPKGAPIPLDPSLSDDVFDDVMRAIAQAGRDIERSPNTYTGLGEEDRRQVLLAILNGQYRGLTTAEAFNVAGKTDLRIMYEGQNSFIAECKFWSGAKGLSDTLDQLFGYGGWRDTKLAAIMFVREKGLTEIVEKARAALAEHPQFALALDDADETELRARVCWAGDDQRIVDLAVRFIHTPTG